MEARQGEAVTTCVLLEPAALPAFTAYPSPLCHFTYIPCQNSSLAPVDT